MAAPFSIDVNYCANAWRVCSFHFAVIVKQQKHLVDCIESMWQACCGLFICNKNPPALKLCWNTKSNQIQYIVGVHPHHTGLTKTWFCRIRRWCWPPEVKLHRNKPTIIPNSLFVWLDTAITSISVAVPSCLPPTTFSHKFGKAGPFQETPPTCYCASKKVPFVGTFWRLHS